MKVRTLLFCVAAQLSGAAQTIIAFEPTPRIQEKLQEKPYGSKDRRAQSKDPGIGHKVEEKSAMLIEPAELQCPSGKGA